MKSKKSSKEKTSRLFNRYVWLVDVVNRTGRINKEKSVFDQSLFDFLEPYEYEVKHTSGHVDVKFLNAVYETVNQR